VDRGVLGHVGRKYGPIRPHQTVTLVGGVMGQMRLSVELVDQAVPGDVRRPREQRHGVLRRPVFLKLSVSLVPPCQLTSTHVVHQPELLVGKFLFFGHHVLGQLEERILVAPEELPHGHFDERLDLQDVHDAGHRQPQESGRVLRLRGGALQGYRFE
jgi:hypothetical protein